MKVIRYTVTVDTSRLDYTKPASLNHVEGVAGTQYGIGAVTLKGIKGYTGKLDVLYAGDTAVPATAGQYTVTVEIEGDDNVTDTTLTLGIYTIKAKTDAVAQGNREVPDAIVIGEAAVAPVKASVAAFTAGPSPAKLGGKVSFFSKSAVKSGSLYVFDASGNAVAKIDAKPGIGEIGSWNLKDKKGALVSEGTYVVKGALVGKDGTREKVSFVFSVVK